MSTRVQGDVLLVGSLPFDTSEEAFRACGEALRGHVGWLPDGEVGPRTNWVGMLPMLVLGDHPDLEKTLVRPGRTLEHPERDANPGPVEDIPGIWNFRVKPGH